MRSMNFIRETQMGNLEKVKEYLENPSIDVNKKDFFGSTALFYACKFGFMDLIEFLRSKGATFDVVNTYGQTPLIAACTALRRDVVDIILSETTEHINVGDKEGYTPLFWAINPDHLDLIKLLVEKGADSTVKSVRGNTILHFAISRCRTQLNNPIENFRANRTEATKNDKFLELIDYCLSLGVDVGAPDLDGNSCVGLAVTRCDSFVVERLLSIGPEAGVNTRNSSGETPLHSLIESTVFMDKSFVTPEQLKIVDLLLANGADLTLTNAEGLTPLKLAEKYKSGSIIKKLS